MRVCDKCGTTPVEEYRLTLNRDRGEVAIIGKTFELCRPCFDLMLARIVSAIKPVSDSREIPKLKDRKP